MNSKKLNFYLTLINLFNMSLNLSNEILIEYITKMRAAPVPSIELSNKILHDVVFDNIMEILYNDINCINLIMSSNPYKFIDNYVNTFNECIYELFLHYEITSIDDLVIMINVIFESLELISESISHSEIDEIVNELYEKTDSEINYMITVLKFNNSSTKLNFDQFMFDNLIC